MINNRSDVEVKNRFHSLDKKIKIQEEMIRFLDVDQFGLLNSIAVPNDEITVCSSSKFSDSSSSRSDHSQSFKTNGSKSSNCSAVEDTRNSMFDNIYASHSRSPFLPKMIPIDRNNYSSTMNKVRPSGLVTAKPSISHPNFDSHLNNGFNDLNGFNDFMITNINAHINNTLLIDGMNGQFLHSNTNMNSNF